MTDDRTTIALRVPPDLAEALTAAAEQADLSRNAYIVESLRRALTDRADLETPGAGEAPAFRLVPRWQGEPHPPHRDVPNDHPYDEPDPDGYATEVEGHLVPHLSVTQHDNGSYWLSLDGRFGVQAHTYEELWRWGWFLAHAIAIGAGRASHAYPARIRQLVDEGWAIMDKSGCGGASYEMTLTFSLPTMADGDQWAYEARDMAQRTLSDAGARDVCTRLVALGSLMIDRRDREPAEIAEIEAYGPISQVLTIPSATHDDGRVEETTIEIGVPTTDES